MWVYVDVSSSLSLGYRKWAVSDGGSFCSLGACPDYEKKSNENALTTSFLDIWRPHIRADCGGCSYFLSVTSENH